MIEVKNIYQAYGEQEVLKDVSITIPEEKITAIIGANGAGKSTLLGVISRLIKQKSGDIFLDQKNIKEMHNNEIAKTLSILKQANTMMIRLTIEELVTFGRFPHHRSRLKTEDMEKINEALHYMDLEDIKHKYLDELSGGQRQRAFIAMILAQDTKYILLDEPLNNLDIKYAIEMMMILKRLVTDLKKTIVLVMHDINIAAAYADYIIALKDGQVIEEGSAEYMMDKNILDIVFNHNFCIAGFRGKKICLYHNDIAYEEGPNPPLKIIQDYFKE